jgi:hypothetical protein
MNFTLNCGTDGLDVACTFVGVRVSTSRLDSNKKTIVNAKKLSANFIIYTTVVGK